MQGFLTNPNHEDGLQTKATRKIATGVMYLSQNLSLESAANADCLVVNQFYVTLLKFQEQKLVADIG
jgi:hypothetical protein